MRKWICVIAAIALLNTIIYGQTITMEISGITDKSGETVKALEFKIDAESSFTSGSGSTRSKANPGLLMVKKDNGLSINDLFKKMVKGTIYPEVVFTYNDETSKPYFRITLSNAFVNQLYFLSPECPTCLKLEEQLGFSFEKIKIEDLAHGTSSIWDISANVVN